MEERGGAERGKEKRERGKGREDRGTEIVEVSEWWIGQVRKEQVREKGGGE